MKKRGLELLTISMICFIILIPFIASDRGNLNNINKGLVLNISSDRELDNNLKNPHGTDYNLTQKEEKTLRYTNKSLNNSELNIGTSNFIFKEVNYIKGKNKEIISYKQEYKDIPIYGSFLNLVKKNNTVISIKENYYTDINVNVKKNISKGQINSAIGKNLNIQLKSKFNKIDITDINLSKISEETVILPIETGADIQYRLVKKIDLPVSKYPLASWTYFIDIENGKTIKKINSIIFENVNGYISGNVYPENPNETLQEQKFTGNYISLQTNVNRSYYSNGSYNSDSFIKTKEEINLSDVSSFATLSFLTKYKTENNYDFAYIWISKDDGVSWDYPPVRTYTGLQSNWINQSINISDYAGENILLAFEYVVDDEINYEGFYIDDIEINTDKGIKFQENFENGTDKWNITGFNISRSYSIVNYTYTDKNGFYNLDGQGNNSTIYSYLSGEFAEVVNMGDKLDIFYDKDVTIPGTYNWSWFDYDSSYKNEESNLFYHVNKAHDFFTKGSPFDITDMDYQMKIIYQLIYPEPFDTYCNAASNGVDMFFFPKIDGYCDALTLYSDVIYHEYAHTVVAQIYGSTELPYENQSGAMNEGWADYFSATINNNSCMAEEFMGLPCLRDLNNTNKYPENFTDEVHEDGKIFSGALWDLRSKVGADLSDNLTIETIKLKSQDFFEYLDDLLFVDNNYEIPSNGTPNWHEICSSFSPRGIISDFCSPIVISYNPSISIGNEGSENISIIWENPIPSTYTTVNYCSPPYSDCNFSNYEKNTEIQFGLDGTYTANFSINKTGTWNFFIYTISNGINYTSENYSINVSNSPFCGDSICNGNETCFICSQDCGICEIHSSGGGSDRLEVSQEWTLTEKINENQINNNYSKELRKNNRINFTISGENHYLGIRTINVDSVVIELASTPRNITFTLGETKKFNLTSEDYYDFQITLNKIEDSKANLTLLKIYERINKQLPVNEEEVLGNESERNTDKINEENLNIYIQPPTENPPNKGIQIYILIILILLISVIEISIKLIKIHRRKYRHHKKNALLKIHKYPHLRR